jgi:hypothetical protein
LRTANSTSPNSAGCPNRSGKPTGAHRQSHLPGLRDQDSQSRQARPTRAFLRE